MQYKELAAKWKEYKDLESLANTGRLKIERAICELVGKDLKEKGVNHLPENLDITTGMDEKWDDTLVNEIYLKWQDKAIELPFFPFKSEWKPDSKKIAVLKELMPAVFIKTFSSALTIKPKKPSFSLKKEK